ncbi:unnamed protein product [Trichobilharzia regenti]|nr:unnamed protein product [Trichobilharzia regenti]
MTSTRTAADLIAASSDVYLLSTNIPVKDSRGIICNLLCSYNKPSLRCSLTPGKIMGCLKLCIASTLLKLKESTGHHKDGIAVRFSEQKTDGLVRCSVSARNWLLHLNDTFM